ncbi:MAG: PPOX class F420-dependent oxidoreductase [Pseudomonadales bacterium]|nr:PPOX class F420-dependent oxidoreductase [Pseudomonadales bacterium]
MPTNEFDEADYINLGTFRKTGARVDTPVWFAEQDNAFFVLSNNQAGKVKRLRNGQRCQIAPCTLFGTVTGQWYDAEASILDDEEAIKTAYDALKQKYGWQMHLLDTGARIGGRIDQRTFLRITKPA